MESLRKLSNDNLITAYFSAVKLKLSNEFVKILKNEITKRNLSNHQKDEWYLL